MSRLSVDRGNLTPAAVMAELTNDIGVSAAAFDVETETGKVFRYFNPPHVNGPAAAGLAVEGGGMSRSRRRSRLELQMENAKSTGRFITRQSSIAHCEFEDQRQLMLHRQQQQRLFLDNEMHRGADVACLSPDGGSVKTTMVSGSSSPQQQPIGIGVHVISGRSQSVVDSHSANYMGGPVDAKEQRKRARAKRRKAAFVKAESTIREDLRMFPSVHRLLPIPLLRKFDSEQPDLAQRRRARPKALIVDGNLFHLAACREIFARYFEVVQCVPSADQALDLLDHVVFDVALIAPDLPGELSGLDLVDAIRHVELKSRHSFRTLVIATFTFEQTKNHTLLDACFCSGMDRFLVKPAILYVQLLCDLMMSGSSLDAFRRLALESQWVSRHDHMQRLLGDDATESDAVTAVTAAVGTEETQQKEIVSIIANDGDREMVDKLHERQRNEEINRIVNATAQMKRRIMDLEYEVDLLEEEKVRKAYLENRNLSTLLAYEKRLKEAERELHEKAREAEQFRFKADEYKLDVKNLLDNGCVNAEMVAKAKRRVQRFQRMMEACERQSMEALDTVLQRSWNNYYGEANYRSHFEVAQFVPHFATDTSASWYRSQLDTIIHQTTKSINTLQKLSDDVRTKLSRFVDVEQPDLSAIINVVRDQLSTLARGVNLETNQLRYGIGDSVANVLTRELDFWRMMEDDEPQLRKEVGEITSYIDTIRSKFHDQVKATQTDTFFWDQQTTRDLEVIVEKMATVSTAEAEVAVLMQDSAPYLPDGSYSPTSHAAYEIFHLPQHMQDALQDSTVLQLLTPLLPLLRGDVYTFDRTRRCVFGYVYDKLAAYDLESRSKYRELEDHVVKLHSVVTATDETHSTTSAGGPTAQSLFDVALSAAGGKRVGSKDAPQRKKSEALSKAAITNRASAAPSPLLPSSTASSTASTAPMQKADLDAAVRVVAEFIKRAKKRDADDALRQSRGTSPVVWETPTATAGLGLQGAGKGTASPQPSSTAVVKQPQRSNAGALKPATSVQIPPKRSGGANSNEKGQGGRPQNLTKAASTMSSLRDRSAPASPTPSSLHGAQPPAIHGSPSQSLSANPATNGGAHHPGSITNGEASPSQGSANGSPLTNFLMHEGSAGFGRATASHRGSHGDEGSSEPTPSSVALLGNQGATGSLDLGPVHVHGRGSIPPSPPSSSQFTVAVRPPSSGTESDGFAPANDRRWSSQGARGLHGSTDERLVVVPDVRISEVVSASDFEADPAAAMGSVLRVRSQAADEAASAALVPGSMAPESQVAALVAQRSIVSLCDLIESLASHGIDLRDHIEALEKERLTAHGNMRRSQADHFTKDESLARAAHATAESEAKVTLLLRALFEAHILAVKADIAKRISGVELEKAQKERSQALAQVALLRSALGETSAAPSTNDGGETVSVSAALLNASSVKSQVFGLATTNAGANNGQAAVMNDADAAAIAAYVASGGSSLARKASLQDTMGPSAAANRRQRLSVAGSRTLAPFEDPHNQQPPLNQEVSMHIDTFQRRTTVTMVPSAPTRDPTGIGVNTFGPTPPSPSQPATAQDDPPSRSGGRRPQQQQRRMTEADEHFLPYIAEKRKAYVPPPRVFNALLPEALSSKYTSSSNAQDGSTIVLTSGISQSAAAGSNRPRNVTDIIRDAFARYEVDPRQSSGGQMNAMESVASFQLKGEGSGWVGGDAMHVVSMPHAQGQPGHASQHEPRLATAPSTGNGALGVIQNGHRDGAIGQMPSPPGTADRRMLFAVKGKRSGPAGSDAELVESLVVRPTRPSGGPSVVPAVGQGASVLREGSVESPRSAAEKRAVRHPGASRHEMLARMMSEPQPPAAT